MATPEDIVQRQLEAFNDHDLETLLPLVAEDVVIVDLVDGTEVLRGIDAFRERYVTVFRDRPSVHAHLVGRLTLGPFVIDRERLTDGEGRASEDALAIYEVSGDVVTRMWFIEPEHRRHTHG